VNKEGSDVIASYSIYINSGCEMAKAKKLKINIVLSVEQLEELDYLLDLHLDGEGDVRRINRGVLMDLREKINRGMEIVAERIAFSVVRRHREPKYLM